MALRRIAKARLIMVVATLRCKPASSALRWKAALATLLVLALAAGGSNGNRPAFAASAGSAEASVPAIRLNAEARMLLEARSSAQQAIVVSSVPGSDTMVVIQSFAKREGEWTGVYRMAGHIGKTGFADAGTKREGDGKSPTGLYTLGIAFGKYANPGTKLPYRKMTASDVWVDDPKSKFYNTLQKLPAEGQWTSAEKMKRSDKLYDYGFVINYNTAKPKPGNGSAIFFHVSSGPTLGCTGTSQTNLLKLLRWLDPDKHPVIIFIDNNS